ncbi:MAG TPA: EthD family reductase [Pseudonocardiaceae bacterium]|nr:EthD family reductase [Pseudonocardiaceae bacterium]
MIKYVALYRKPADTETFDRRYFAEHMPLVSETPGLVRAEVARVGRVFVPGFLGDTEPYLMAELYFESKESMRAAFGSPQWQAAGANLAEIGGMEVVSMFSAELAEDVSEDGGEDGGEDGTA